MTLGGCFLVFRNTLGETIFFSTLGGSLLVCRIALGELDIGYIG
jgi:hypothetical protein